MAVGMGPNFVEAQLLVGVIAHLLEVEGQIDEAGLARRRAGCRCVGRMMAQRARDQRRLTFGAHPRKRSQISDPARDCGGCSGDLSPPSPPAEKTTASQD